MWSLLPETRKGDSSLAALCYCRGVPDLELGVSWGGGEVASSVPASLLSLDLMITHSLTGTVLPLSLSLHKCSEWP